MTLPRTVSKIPIHLYGGVCYFAKTRKDFEKAYKHLYDCEYPDNSENAAGLTCEETHKDGQCVYLLGVFDGKMSTVLHEASHCCMFVLKRAGINPYDDRGEGFAYLLEYLVEALMKKMIVKHKREIVEYPEGKEW